MLERIFFGRHFWIRISERFRFVHNRPFCTSNKPTTSNPIDNSSKADGSLSQHDTYRDLEKLDFMTASKILFTTPPKRKKFGIDFHLVQLFFVCMPSLAVYLVAQYARYEMRRMDADLEKKKQAEAAKGVELKATEEKAARSDPEILEVKVRLDKLEETIKEIVIESKKQSGRMISESRKGDKKQYARTSHGNNGNRSEANNSAVQERIRGSNEQETSPSATLTDASVNDQKLTQDGRPSQDERNKE